MVPDPSRSIRGGAIASWSGAWQDKNLRAALGYDIDRPWRELSPAARNWILFTDEKPVVTVEPEREPHRIHRPYQGTYTSAERLLLRALPNTCIPRRARCARADVSNPNRSR
ncbi:hypothetical protein [Nocardia rhizosphaerihabitans]|nr:hypothetical protein [Nocardia rhizosphaerihabitans]